MDSLVVVLDPDGMGPDWMYVVVERPTGVRYEQQYGGTACMRGRVEGFLVPVHSDAARRALDDLFVRDLRGTGLWGGSRAPDQDIVRRVAEVVATVSYWRDDGPVPLALDDGRRKDIDEAWLPVITPDGPGVLLWPNSD